MNVKIGKNRVFLQGYNTNKRDILEKSIKLF
jgi:hypothetical protein